jgi:hypothetical protein
LHANVSPSKDSWISAGSGIGGAAFSYVILMTDARVELYLDRGANREDETKRLFDDLFAQREQIEWKFGAPLVWERLDDRRACRISYLVGLGGLSDRGKWPAIQDAMVDAMARLHGALAERARLSVARP